MRLITTVFALSIVGAINGIATASDADMHADSSVVLAEVNGNKLTLADLEQKRAAGMFQARTNYYEAQRKLIESLVDESLLEQRAKKEGLTVEELLDRHVDKAIAKDPPEESLRVYYEGIDTTESYEVMRSKIIDAIRQRRLAKAKNAYVQSLRAQAPMIIRMAPPRAPIAMKNVPVRGAGSSPITMLEFADYECPYCQQIQPILDRIEQEFKGKLAFAYKDYPLPMHPNAQKAAEAAHCAGSQAKYWEYHDAMLTNKVLDLASLKRYARDLKLDTAAFDTCLDGGQKADVVKTNMTEAQGMGLQGTPTVFINGRYVSGELSYERIRNVIAEELSAIEGSVGSGKASARPNE